MAENPRIAELRRRVQADPASIAFAALAEEFRRVGRYEEAIETCRTGLQRHPAYLSARVTLGRALIETGDYEGAREELETVLRSAPENLTAIRGLAQINERLGHSTEMDPHLADMMNTMHAESIRVAAQPPPEPPIPVPVPVPVPVREVHVASVPEPPPPQLEPEPELELTELEDRPQPELDQDPAFDLALEPPVEVSPSTDPDLALTAFTLDHMEIGNRRSEIGDRGSEVGEAMTLDEPDVDVPAGPDPEMLATLATIARLERFLGAIQSLRA